MIISDCMEMDAVAKFYGTVNGAAAALKAGADIVCISHTAALARETAERLWQRYEAAEGEERRELERSGVPCNLIISDAGGLSVLTAWAAGKLSSTSVSKFIQENVEDKIKCRKLIIPGKVAVLKGDIEAKLPGWEVIVAPNEAVQLVKFLKDMQANGEI